MRFTGTGTLRIACGLVMLTLSACGPRPARVSEALPRASVAAPWVLAGDVWEGSLSEAEPGLGPDAEAWRPFGPERVWLAVYRHEDRPDRRLVVRVFAFASAQDAHLAYLANRPAGAKPFHAGDEGCWTGLGVLFRWGRLVFDIFGPEATPESEYEAARFTGYIEHAMPAGLPETPQ